MKYINPILYIDGYKLDHRRQYPAGTQRVYSNWTPRESRVEGVDEVVFLGLQYFLQRYLMEEFNEKFFGAPVDTVCKLYQDLIDRYLGPNTIGTDHIRALHKLGYLPLVFKAVPEGTRVPLRVPLLTIENTQEEFFWLTNYFETLMSAELWLASTSATIALRTRKLLDTWAAKTGDPSFVDWQGHDFSFRGMEGVEAACLSGMGHLVAFTGTDTIPAVEFIRHYYSDQWDLNAHGEINKPSIKELADNYMIGGSVAATEHSVMCAGGEEDEYSTYKRLIDLYPSGILSVVSDTWDLWKVLTVTIPTLKGEVLGRTGKLVIRPDSGDPVKIICGDPDAASTSPAAKGVVQVLWDIFGGSVNEKGYRVLDPHIGVIYGDGINYDRAKAICEGLAENNFASTNLVFGIGSYNYQYVTRDTFGFAMKATWVQIDGKGMDIFKTPVTDSGMKNSARGRLAVVDDGHGKLRLVNQAPEVMENRMSLLRPVWKDGFFIRKDNFQTIRERARGKSLRELVHA